MFWMLYQYTNAVVSILWPKGQLQSFACLYLELWRSTITPTNANDGALLYLLLTTSTM